MEIIRDFIATVREHKVMFVVSIVIILVFFTLLALLAVQIAHMT